MATMTTICPYCNKEIEDAIQCEWAGDDVVNFDFECPKCGKTMEIDVVMDPVFLAHKKSNDKNQNGPCFSGSLAEQIKGERKLGDMAKKLGANKAQA